MSSAMLAVTLENLQHCTRFILKSRSYVLPFNTVGVSVSRACSRPNCFLLVLYPVIYLLLSLLLLLRWGETMFLCLCGTGPVTDPLSFHQMINERIWSSGGMILTGQTDRKCIYQSANPGLHDQKPATNRLSYGTASC
jgi:hypothetical protein